MVVYRLNEISLFQGINIGPNLPNFSRTNLILVSDNASSINDNWFSIIIGRNGVGKSRLLASIADGISVSMKEFPRVPDSRFNLKLYYSVNGINYNSTVGPDTGKRTGIFDDVLGSSVGPTKIIASTITPFDKFRLSKDVIGQRIPRSVDNFNQTEESLYYYTGLRDSNGRTNFQNTVLRAIRGIFSNRRMSEQRRSKLKDVFSFLGYKPSISLLCTLKNYTRTLNIIDILLNDSIDLYDKQNWMMEFGGTRLKFLVSNNEDAIFKLIDAIKLVKSESNRDGSLRINVELYDSDYYNELLECAFYLRDVQILEFSEIKIFRTDGYNNVSLFDASSGEISIVCCMLGIASHIEDGSLILIDEPEISLHPEWQHRFISLLQNTFSMFIGCHFIIATHSPIIVADSPAQCSTIINLTPDAELSNDDPSYSGASTDEVLATAFASPGDDNLYVKQEFIKALNIVSNGDINNIELKEKISFLAATRLRISNNSKLAKAIDDLLEAIRIVVKG